MGKAKKPKSPLTPKVASPADAFEAEQETKSAVPGVSISFGSTLMEGDQLLVIEQLGITCFGLNLLEDASIKLSTGQRYGLLGPNGCGKSTFLKCLASREIPFSKHISHYFVNQEVAATEMSALDAVMSVDTEKERLEEECERLESDESAEAQDRLTIIYERLDKLESDTLEARASRLLKGLGFNPAMQRKMCKDYSGGWRMRIALAQGLLVNPKFLILDEPSNHLDIKAVVWLEDYLAKFEGILLCVSHSQDFLNTVCNNILRMHQSKLEIYKGNYDQYMQTRGEKEENQMKAFGREQDQIQHMKEYIARFGHGSAKLARQAQSKEKTLAKMVRGGLTEAVGREEPLCFTFADPGKVAGVVMQFQDVAFNYPNSPKLYTKLSFGLDLDSRIALVGPNGAGKTTLQKLMCGLLEPTEGQIVRNGHLRVVRFAQHFVDQLPFDLNPIEYMQSEFPDLRDIKEVRPLLGRFGCSGKCQLQSIGTLSEGQKARVMFAWMAYKTPHILMLDEPTNALDMETIDSLADAINDYEGGVVLVSHDIRLIAQVAEDIWICDNNTVKPFKGDISSYKKHIKKEVDKERADG